MLWPLPGNRLEEGHMLEEVGLNCPYCGEAITVLVDASAPAQGYIEDCEVCCRPMILTSSIEGGCVRVDVRHEDA